MFLVTERILLTVWLGSMWTVGYIVAPTLFNTLDDRMLAGQVAGQLFSISSYIGLFCASLLLIGIIYRAPKQVVKNWRVWVLLSMLMIIVIAEFVFQPMMAELKSQGISPGSHAARQFGQLHGTASVFFLINSLLGLVLLVFGLNANQTNGLEN